jgi:hypothetical protein
MLFDDELVKGSVKKELPNPERENFKTKIKTKII